MGRSSPASSCLRIIACSGGVDDGEPTANTSENKSSGDKRRWSFRKKSGKRGMMISGVVSETTATSKTRETLESVILESPSPDHENVSEKQTFSVDEKKSQLPVAVVDEKKSQSVGDKSELSVQCLEEPIEDRTELPDLVESKGTETEAEGLIGTGLQSNLEGPNGADASVIEKDITSEVEFTSKLEAEESETVDGVVIRKESDEEVNEKLDDSVIMIIQAAIRGFLARRELLRRKKVVKLQAAFRGHLVRSQARGSLRCVQAIVKMQALVRSRHSTKVGNCVSAISDKVETNGSAQKLLENKFAKHLMESTPKTKPICIKCDPTKPSSAWNWLERWMSVSEPEKAIKADLAADEQQLEEIQDAKGSDQVEFMKSDSMSETKIETAFSSCEASKQQAQHVELSETEKKNQYTTQDYSVEDFAPAELGVSEDGNEISVGSFLDDTVDNKSGVEVAEPMVEAKLLENGSIKTERAEVKDIEVKDETPLGTVEEPMEKVKISAVISTPASRKRRAEDEPGPQTPTIITESQATPASQASSSVKARKAKSEKSSSASTQKQKVSKKITSSPKQETGTDEANTTEQKSGRRKSFGIELDTRESSGSKSSLPRFMQPTQSAKAKVQEHNSPRSSPDLQERHIVSAKKRHSLPVVGNGKEKEGISPRIQRSASQAQQVTKDRKWQR